MFLVAIDKSGCGRGAGSGWAFAVESAAHLDWTP